MEKTMKKEIGLWIDHRKAVIVRIENKVEVTREIISHMQKHTRFSSNITAEDTSDRKFGDQLGRFYERVVSSIRDADAILIIGPGEAKGELENLLKKEGLGGRIVGIETDDKLTNPQIAAKVRAHFFKAN
jgi:hypothetical protein